MAQKDKLKTKKMGFFRKQKEKLDKKRRERKLLLKKHVSPVKQLKSLTADKIKEYLEDSPLLQTEPEFADFAFNPELVVKHTQSSLERYQERFAENADGKNQLKRELYEDFCIETTGKLISKPFVVSLRRRLRLAAKRLKDEGQTTQMMRAIVCEATLNIPQIPVEAHPLVVGMYEDIRQKEMGDTFTIKGFENVLYWKRRVELEREEERTVILKAVEPERIQSTLSGDARFSPMETGGFRLTLAETATPAAEGQPAEPPATIDVGNLTIDGGLLTFKGVDRDKAKQGRELLETVLAGMIAPVDEEPADTADEGDDESEDAPVNESAPEAGGDSQPAAEPKE